MKWKAPTYRKSYKRLFGARCFLEPKRLKYPICKAGRVSCKALNAAHYYARLNHNTTVTRKIKQLRKVCHL
jgi:hypothetical protein